MAWETHYCSACGGTGESWNPMRGVFDGTCGNCKGSGEVRVRVSKRAPASTGETEGGSER